MTLDRIYELVSLLPPESTYPHSAPLPLHDHMGRSTRSLEQDRRAAARTDPRFGWKFVMCFVRLGLKLPDLAKETILNRAYRYEMLHERDSLISEAILLDHRLMSFARNVIQASLIIEGLSYRDIGEQIGYDKEVVYAYEQLFFNVRDRRSDRAYIASLVFPDHTTVELSPHYTQMTHSNQHLMRMAWRHGAEPMLNLAGMQARNVEHQANEMGRRLESAIMANAVQVSRLGLLNQANVPGLMHGRAIITATKQSGVEQTQDESVIGLQRLSMGQSVMTSIYGQQGGLVKERRKLRGIYEEEAKKRRAADVEVVGAK